MATVTSDNRTGRLRAVALAQMGVAFLVFAYSCLIALRSWSTGQSGDVNATLAVAMLWASVVAAVLAMVHR